MIAKIALALGILGLLLGLAVTAISLALPIATDGRTSWEEAMLGIIPGILLVVVAFIWTAVSLIFVIKGRKQQV